MLLDQHEASRLVEATRRIVLDDTETYGWVSLSKARVDEVNEKSSSYSLVPTRRDDCDRQFGDILCDEPVAVARLGVLAIPGRAHRSVLFGNQPIVALSRPSGEVHRVSRICHHLFSGRRRLVWAPNSGLAEHRREKGKVINSGWAALNVFHTAQSISSARLRDGSF